MRMFNPHFVLVSALGLLTAASCTLITDVDRKKIPPPDTGSPEGGQGASGGSAGRGGTGGTGGSGGDAGDGAGQGGSGGSSGEASGGAGESGAGSGGGGTGGGAGEAGNAGAGGVVPVCTKASGEISLETDPRTFFQDGDRFTVGDGIIDAITFEFDCGAGVVCNPPGSVAGVGAGRQEIVFDGTEDEAGMAALIVNAINGTGLRITANLVSDNGGGGGAGGEGGAAGAAPSVPGEPIVIALAHELYGDRGNVEIGERVANGNFDVSGLSGGEAVSCAATETACSDDDACESASCDTDTHVCE
jgi:hypothetical protein